MKPKHITFTGIDANTDPTELQRIQYNYPMVEFGLLVSYSLADKDNRYCDPTKFGKFFNKGLNLSLHLCGTAAVNAANGKWLPIDLHLGGRLSEFKRIQLNIAHPSNTLEHVQHSTYIAEQEIIIQQRNKDNDSLFKNALYHWPIAAPVSILLDASGGRGIDTPIDIYPYDCKVGYAGGFNPDNVESKLSYLMQNVTKGEYWIDMESGVRTDGWFDIAKVMKVLQIAEHLFIKDETNSLS